MNWRTAVFGVIAANVVFAALGCSPARAQVPAEIHIPGDRVFPESLTSSADGAVYVGSVVGGGVYRAPPGGDTATLFIPPGRDGLHSVFGVYADDRTETLWVCSNTLDPAGRSAPSHGELHSFNLITGASLRYYALPSTGAYCNDIAVGRDGTVYATDSNNMQIVRLAPGATELGVWSPDGAFGAKGGLLDGISLVSNAVIVNTFMTGKLFGVSLKRDGSAGPVMEIPLSRGIDHPDGMRAFGKRNVLVVEGGGPGRLSKVALSGLSGFKGQVSTLKEGYPDGPTAVTVVGSMAYVIEAQFKALMGGAEAKINPFHATAVRVGKP